MSLFLRSLALSSAVIGLASLAAPATAAPLRAHAQDLGATPAAQTVTASIVLKVRSTDALEALVALTQEPGLPTFHHFLSVREFTDLFAPSQRDIATITGYLHSFGITVTEVLGDRLLIKATGSAEAFDQAFAVDLHEFSRNGKHFHRGHHAPRIPLLLRDLLVSVQGFSTEDAQYHPMRKSAVALTPMFTPPPVLERLRREPRVAPRRRHRRQQLVLQRRARLRARRRPRRPQRRQPRGGDPPRAPSAVAPRRPRPAFRSRCNG